MTQIEDILSKQVAVADKLLQRAIAIPDGDEGAKEFTQRLVLYIRTL